MAVFLAAAILQPWHAPTAVDVLDGMATYYTKGLMEQVAQYRGEDLSHYAGGVALNPAGDLGRVVWLEPLDTAQGRHNDQIEGPFLVVDCAQAAHYAQRLQQNRVVEVDWETAQRWGMQGPAPVRVWFHKPMPGGVRRE